MKFSRPLCLLLSLTILFSIFVVPSRAATNLINPNILEWENVTTSTSDIGKSLMYVHKEGTISKPIYRLQPTIYGEGEVNGQPVTTYSGWTLAPSMLRVGDNYTFRIHIPSPEEIRAVTDYTHSDEYFANWIGGVGFYICFGGFAADGSLTRVVEFVCINKDNYLSYAGRDLVYSFQCPDFNVSDPGIYIFNVDITYWSPSVLFLDDSLCLVNDSAVDEEGFFSRLFEWFQEKFDAIGDSFSNLGSNISSGLSGLGDRISDFFINLGSSITNGLNSLLDGIGGWFQKLGNLILYLQWTDTPPENPFKMEDGPLASVREFFDVIVDYFSDIEDDFESVIDSVTGPVYLLDKFTERFDWLLGILVFTLLMIVISRFIGL